MGYTHYFRRPDVLDEGRFKNFIVDCQAIINKSGKKLLDGEFDVHRNHEVIYD